MSFGTVQAEKMTTESGYSLGAGNASSFKNRFLNGNMAIDQRNNGSAVTVTNAAVNFFGVDRFAANRANGYALSTSTVQQVTDAPAGFIKSVKYTNSTAETPTGAMYSNLAQYIEGNNVADLGWGTANAKSATLSFWVKISITGTFGVVLRSATATQSYAISFAYSTADTWQFVTATIPGPTTGTFYTDNNVGFSVNWDLGVGPTLSIAATGAWQTANGLGLASGTKVNSTAGATYQITGCQIEVGTVASSFDFRSYGTEMMLCQRYYQQHGFYGVVGQGQNADRNSGSYVSFFVPMRTTPTTIAKNYDVDIGDLNIAFTPSIYTDAIGQGIGWRPYRNVSTTITRGDTMEIMANAGTEGGPRHPFNAEF
jgi:hypothetical protein